MGTVALFVDGSNMFHAQRKMGFFIDFGKLKNHFSSGSKLFDAFYYMGVTSLPMPESKQRFYDYLIFNKYTVRVKTVKTVYDDKSGNPVQKCNLDIEMVIDLFDFIKSYDKAILFTGDGDFERVIQTLRTRGKLVDVVSCKGMIAREIANEANNVIYLEDHRRYIERTDKSPEEKDAPKTQHEQDKKRE